MQPKVLLAKSSTQPVSPGPQFGYGAAWIERASTYLMPVGCVNEIGCPRFALGWLPVWLRPQVNISYLGPLPAHHCVQGWASPPCASGALHGADGACGTEAGRTTWCPKMLAGGPAKHGKIHAQVEEPTVPSHAEQPLSAPFHTQAPSEALM